MRASESESRFQQLSELIKTAKRLLIFTHPQADPDTLASALALHRIASHLGKKAYIFLSSELGRSENKTMAKLLRIPIKNMPTVIPSGTRALVDAQPRAHTPNGVKDFDIVFDHHPLMKQTKKVKFWDVRPQCGACSTILTEYVFAAGIKPDKYLGTALFYGIKTDVGELARVMDASDIEAMKNLFPYISPRLLNKIDRARLPIEFFSALATGLANATIYGKLITAKLPKGSPPEIAALLADLLLRSEGMSWSMCATEYNDKLYFSLRALKASKRHAGEIVAKLIGSLGSGGGHALSAGGYVQPKNKSFDELYETTVSRLAKMLKQDLKAPKKLLLKSPC